MEPREEENSPVTRRVSQLIRFANGTKVSMRSRMSMMSRTWVALPAKHQTLNVRKRLLNAMDVCESDMLRETEMDVPTSLNCTTVDIGRSQCSR
jgi:hypothetical protein